MHKTVDKFLWKGFINLKKKTSYLKHIYKNELDKAFFAHDATYSESKDLAKRTILDNILKDRAMQLL